jgi:hypothetical protein
MGTMHEVVYECPACGGKAKLLKATYFDGRVPSTGWFVECDKRDCGYCTGEFADPDDAIAAWDRSRRPADKED